MAYTDNKKISGLDAASAVSGSDMVIIQKNGEAYAKRITITQFFAAGAGVDYRAGHASLTVGSNSVSFTTPLATGSVCVLLLVVRNSSGEDIGYQLVDQDENGFVLSVDYAGSVKFFGIIER